MRRLNAEYGLKRDLIYEAAPRRGEGGMKQDGALSIFKVVPSRIAPRQARRGLPACHSKIPFTHELPERVRVCAPMGIVIKFFHHSLH